MTERLATIRITTSLGTYVIPKVDYTAHEGSFARRGLNAYNVALCVVNQEAAVLSVLWKDITGITVLFDGVAKELKMDLSVIEEKPS